MHVDKDWAQVPDTATLKTHAPSGRCEDFAWGSVEAEKVHARVRMGSPMVPADWTRLGCTHIGGEVLACKGCGAAGTCWDHQTFSCDGWVSERKELFKGYKTLTGNFPTRVEEFLNPKPPWPGEGNIKWPRDVLNGIKEIFTVFVKNTLYAEVRMIQNEEGKGPAEEKQGGGVNEEKTNEGPDTVKVGVGTMVKVVNMDYDEDAKAGPGNREWYLGEVIEMCEDDEGDWINVHFWRSYGRENDPGRIYFPVWASPDGLREVYMRNPRAPGGIKGAERWLHWYAPRELATLGVAVCEEKRKGLRVKAWSMDYEYEKSSQCV